MNKAELLKWIEGKLSDQGQFAVGEANLGEAGINYHINAKLPPVRDRGTEVAEKMLKVVKHDDSYACINFAAMEGASGARFGISPTSGYEGALRTSRETVAAVVNAEIARTNQSWQSALGTKAGTPEEAKAELIAEWNTNTEFVKSHFQPTNFEGKAIYFGVPVPVMKGELPRTQLNSGNAMTYLLNCCDEVAEYLSAAIDDPKSCSDFKDKCRRFLEAHDIYERSISSETTAPKSRDEVLREAINTVMNILRQDSGHCVPEILLKLSK